MTRKIRNSRIRLAALALLLVAAGFLTVRGVVAADHMDSPLVGDDAGADIADVYAFVSPSNPDNLVLAMTVHGFVPPTESSISLFDPNVLYQFKIDTDGNAVEDLVIQAFVTGSEGNQIMRFRGPVVPEVAGAVSSLVQDADAAAVQVSTGFSPIVESQNGMTVFAGVRDDPFFLDFGQFTAIVAGQATGFNNPGTDSFAGFNVYAIVVELPIVLLGGSSDLGIWGTTSR